MSASLNPILSDVELSAAGANLITRARSTTEVALDARKDPESLVGLRIDVHGRGIGRVTGVKKALGKSTMHVVDFDDAAGSGFGSGSCAYGLGSWV